jgi:hypothetical protein
MDVSGLVKVVGGCKFRPGRVFPEALGVFFLPSYFSRVGPVPGKPEESGRHENGRDALRFHFLRFVRAGRHSMETRRNYGMRNGESQFQISFRFALHAYQNPRPFFPAVSGIRRTACKKIWSVRAQ